MDKGNGLSAMQMDALREAGNIGAAHAATSMSSLMNKKIDMEVPFVDIVPFADILDWMGGPDSPVASTLIHISGDVCGKVYFMLAVDEAETFVKYASDEQHVQLIDQDETNLFGASVFKEIGNILTGSYMSAISDFTGLHIQPSVPQLQIDMAGAILSDAVIDVSRSTDYVLIVDTVIRYSGQKNPVNGQFLFLPDPESLATLFRALGMAGNE
ncbi:CheY-P phosphatase CheC [Barrientosiimonas marina]|uniref:Chemotaxis protein CheC n=1 Tax=Lentibacillus kimchii TaxID=1542911 RepID=A0ABW2UU39_9BACI